MSLFLYSKCKTMACSGVKSQLGCLEFCKCERDCRNKWNVSGNIENDVKYSDGKEHGSEHKDVTDNLLE